MYDARYGAQVVRWSDDSEDSPHGTEHPPWYS